MSVLHLVSPLFSSPSLTSPLFPTHTSSRAAVLHAADTRTSATSARHLRHLRARCLPRHPPEPSHRHPPASLAPDVEALKRRPLIAARLDIGPHRCEAVTHTHCSHRDPHSPPPPPRSREATWTCPAPRPSSRATTLSHLHKAATTQPPASAPASAQPPRIHHNPSAPPCTRPRRARRERARRARRRRRRAPAYARAAETTHPAWRVSRPTLVADTSRYCARGAIPGARARRPRRRAAPPRRRWALRGGTCPAARRVGRAPPSHRPLPPLHALPAHRGGRAPPRCPSARSRRRAGARGPRGDLCAPVLASQKARRRSGIRSGRSSLRSPRRIRGRRRGAHGPCIRALQSRL
jgi:hypothetical protein